MQDEQVELLINGEIDRQYDGIELIPSENYVSQDVLRALGSVFTNKYAEGYPGRRYYGGQEFTDQIEQLAIDRAKQLFKADHANVQPHSGAPANEAVYNSWLNPGDTVLAMDLSHGGHLTHGAPVTRSAQLYNFVRYKSDIKTGEIDYGYLRTLALEHRPKIILAGFSSYPGELDYTRFAEIGKEVGALMVADMAHLAGLIAGGVSPNPLEHGFHVMTATTHKTLRGPRGGIVLSMGKVGNPMKKPEKTIENIPTLIDRAIFPGMQGGPHMHSIAAKAVALREASQPEFKDYAQQVLDNADRLAKELTDRGFNLISGGTANHLLVIDMIGSLGIDGKVAESVLESVGITTNANVIPDDPLPAARPSGLRLGTPAITTRGMKVEDMPAVANFIKQTIELREQPQKLIEIQEEVKQFARKFPVPNNS
jgi:glycine hydroxymethyltransferase